MTLPAKGLPAKGLPAKGLPAKARQAGTTGRFKQALKAHFSALDLIEKISENKGLSYNMLFKIIQRTENYVYIVKNHPQHIHRASAIIKNIDLEQMLRGLNYHLTDENFPFEFEEYIRY